MNYAEKDWSLKDVSKEMETNFVLEINSYFEELDDVDEVCTIWMTDAHVESQAENAVLISKAPDMYRLLVECQKQFEILNPGNVCIHKITKLMDELKKHPEEFIGDEERD